jgi:hypothetical protein
MNYCLFFSVIFFSQISHAQINSVYSKRTGPVFYSLQLKTGQEFVFQSSVTSHGEVVSVFDVGVFRKKGDSIKLIVHKSGNAMNDLVVNPVADTLLAIQAGGRHLYFYGRGTGSVKLRKWVD